MSKSDAGKGMDPEKGRDLPKYWDGFDVIDWSKDSKKEKDTPKELSDEEMNLGDYERFLM